MASTVPFSWYTKPYYSHFYMTKRSYYENFHKIVDVDQLLSAATAQAPQFLKTDCPIKVLNVPFDATPGMVSKLLGLPNFKQVKVSQTGICRTTYYYKRPFFRDKAIIQFNFLDELFVNCVVTFIQKKHSGERVYLKIIREKYLSEKEKGLTPLPGITDPQGHLLLFDDSVYCSLVYVNAARVFRNIQYEMDEKLKLASLENWKKHYDNWSENL